MASNYNVTEVTCLSSCNNSVEDSETGEVELSMPWKVFRGSLILFISLLIAISNLVNITVLRGSKQIPRVAKIFLINLGVADLSVGLVTCLPSVVPGFTGRWPYGAVWCQISGILHGTSVTVSIWTIAVVSVERFFAVLLPLKYKNSLSKNKCFTMIAFLWIASFVTYTSPIFTMENFLYYQYDFNTAMCGMHWGNIWLCLVSAIYVPFLSGITILFTTICMTRALKSSTTRNNKVGTQESNGTVTTDGNKNEKQRKAVHLLVATAMAYFGFWGPYVVLTFWQLFGSLVPPGWLEFIVMWLANGNSFINVIIYSFIYQAFRLEAKRYLLRVIRCQCRQAFSRRVAPDTTGTSTF